MDGDSGHAKPMGLREKYLLWRSNRKCRKAYDEWMKQQQFERWSYLEFSGLYRFEATILTITAFIFVSTTVVLCLGHLFALVPMGLSLAEVWYFGRRAFKTRKLMLQALVKDLERL